MSSVPTHGADGTAWLWSPAPRDGCGGLQTQKLSFLSPAGTLAYDMRSVLASQTGNMNIRNANFIILIYELTIA